MVVILILYIFVWKLTRKLSFRYTILLVLLGGTIGFLYVDSPVQESLKNITERFSINTPSIAQNETVKENTPISDDNTQTIVSNDSSSLATNGDNSSPVKENTPISDDNAQTTMNTSTSTSMSPTTTESQVNQSESENRIERILGIGLILFALIIVILSLAVRKLLLWRIGIDGDRSIILPEVHFEKLEETNSGVTNMTNSFTEFRKILSSKEVNTEKRFEEFLSLLSKLQNIVETKDQEITRLKEGYDSKLKKDAILTILKLRERVEYLADQKTNSEDLANASKGMLKIIDHELVAMDVVPFIFEAGESIREIEDFEAIETVETSDQEKIGLVIKTINSGFYIRGQENTKILLKKANIKVYAEE